MICKTCGAHVSGHVTIFGLGIRVRSPLTIMSSWQEVMLPDELSGDPLNISFLRLPYGKMSGNLLVYYIGRLVWLPFKNMPEARLLTLLI
jgi:hypothetical protein